MLKVGLIGVGGISGAHIPCWEQMEDVELVALCDIRIFLVWEYPSLLTVADTVPHRECSLDRRSPCFIISDTSA